jgi:hypothetical protein
VHEKRRDHACQYCPSVAFGTKSDLTKHVNHVHLKLREHARLCCPDVVYQTNCNLKTHIETVHETTAKAWRSGVPAV